MKTNRATGFALVLTFTCFGGLAFMPACSGNQADTIIGPDGGEVTDAPIGPSVDSTTGSVDTGTAAKPDAPGSTFIDSGTGTTPDAGVPVPDAGTGTTGDGGTSGTCPPATCASDSDCGCLTASGSIGCCDTVTTACFQSASATCPDQASSGGGDAGGGGCGF